MLTEKESCFGNKLVMIYNYRQHLLSLYFLIELLLTLKRYRYFIDEAMGGTAHSLYILSVELGYESKQSLHIYLFFPHTQENMHTHTNPGKIL